jgi:hypothetical protein
MPVTYWQHTSASDLAGPNAAIGNYVADRLEGTGSTDINTGNMNSNISTHVYWFTPAGDPGTDGRSTGTFTVPIRITVLNANIGLRLYVRRYNSAGAAQGAGWIESAQGSQTCGVAERIYTWVDPALGTWAAGDRFAVWCHFTNVSANMNQSTRISADTAADTFTTPFEAAAATPQTILLGRATEIDVAHPLVALNPRSTLLGQAAEVSAGGTVDALIEAGEGPFRAPQFTSWNHLDGEVHLAWNHVGGRSGYDLERNGLVIAWDLASNSYVDDDPGADPEYRVRAVKA